MGSDLASDESGAALFEAALVLPVVLLLVFGLTEVSLYLWTRSLAVKAVQLGARQAVVSSAVADGPGLDPTGTVDFWRGLPPGLSCFPSNGGRGPCPSFEVRCASGSGCRCQGDACGFRFAAGRLRPILAAMQAVMPELKPENVEIAYATNGLGYVAQPGPVPVDVRVSLVGFFYHPLFLGDALGRALPIGAAAVLPSEGLRSR